MPILEDKAQQLPEKAKILSNSDRPIHEVQSPEKKKVFARSDRPINEDVTRAFNKIQQGDLSELKMLRNACADL